MNLSLTLAGKPSLCHGFGHTWEAPDAEPEPRDKCLCEARTWEERGDNSMVFSQ